MIKERHCVFIAGGTGYMGQSLIRTLAGTRPRGAGSGASRVGEEASRGLHSGSWQCARWQRAMPNQIAPADTFVQLVGVAHPSPAKAAEFRQVDLPSGLGAIAAAKSAGIRHFVYLSVAHPAPMMHAYIAVRSECEAAIESAGLECDDPAAVVRARARDTGGRILLLPDVQSRGVAARDTRRRATAGAGDLGADDECTNGGGGESCAGNTRGNRAGDPLCMRVKSRANRGVWRR